MTQLISARLPDPTAERVRQYAQRKQRSVNETVSIALEEWLRQNEFAFIEFRDTPNGRMAFMKSSRLPVYQLIKTARGYGMDAERMQAHWPSHPRGWILAAFYYYEAFSHEIDEQIAEYDSASSFDALKRRYPQMEAFSVQHEAMKGG